MKAAGTLAQVNAALKAAGRDERLTRGRGYFYFRGGAAMGWFTSSVYVGDVDAYTVAEWLELHAEMSNAEPGGHYGAAGLRVVTEDADPTGAVAAQVATDEDYPTDEEAAAAAARLAARAVEESCRERDLREHARRAENMTVVILRGMVRLRAAACASGAPADVLRLIDRQAARAAYLFDRCTDQLGAVHALDFYDGAQAPL